MTDLLCDAMLCCPYTMLFRGGGVKHSVVRAKHSNTLLSLHYAFRGGEVKCSIVRAKCSVVRAKCSVVRAKCSVVRAKCSKSKA